MRPQATTLLLLLGEILLGVSDAADRLPAWGADGQCDGQCGKAAGEDPAGGDAELAVPDRRDPYFEYRSSLKVGAKGEESIDVSGSRGCGTFHHAELVWLERRFADAQFVQVPERRCVECAPLIVRWYHEPTGRAHFQVRVYRTPCVDPGTRKNAPAS